MKKSISTIALSLLCFAGLYAQSNLVLFTEQGEKFFVILNGVRQNETAQTNVKVTGLDQPAYKAKIIFEEQSLPQVDKTLYFNEPNMEVVYDVKQNKKGEYVVRPQSATPIAQAPASSAGQDVVVYSATPVAANANIAVSQTTTTTTTTTSRTPNGSKVSMGMNVGGVGMNININVNDADMDYDETHSRTSYSTTTTTTSTSAGAPAQPDHYVMPGYNGPIGCPYPMSNTDFQNAKNSIASKSFSSSKMTMAKQIIGSNCLTSAQVKEIMQTFDFEADKLEFSKYAYGYTYDLGNYYKVNDAFDF